jgi:hypothetical protein
MRNTGKGTNGRHVTTSELQTNVTQERLIIAHCE